MHTNEFVGLVQHGLPLHLVERIPSAERAARETRLQEMGSDEPRRPAAWQPTHTPPRYGAGF